MSPGDHGRAPSAYPGTRDIIGLLSLVASSIYCFAATLTLWTGRTEHHFARWPLMILLAVHGAVLSIGTYSTFNGSIAGGDVLPLLSWFGLIHFESIVFTIGTAVFVPALVKERNEAAIRVSANTDPLTGIANRTAFMERAGRIIDRCRRESAPISVIMFDLCRGAETVGLTLTVRHEEREVLIQRGIAERSGFLTLVQSRDGMDR